MLFSVGGEIMKNCLLLFSCILQLFYMNMCDKIFKNPKARYWLLKNQSDAVS